MRANRAVASLVALVVSVTVAGCGGESGSSGRPAVSRSSSSAPVATASPSPSSSPSPTPTAPKPPRPRPGPKGQEAFARYVVEAWGYSIRTNDARPLLRVSPPNQPCQGCADLARELAQRDKEGWYVAFTGAVVRSVRLSTRNGQKVATMKVDVPESDTFNMDGSYRSTNPAHPRSRFVVGMRFTGREYQLLSFLVG